MVEKDVPQVLNVGESYDLDPSVTISSKEKGLLAIIESGQEEHSLTDVSGEQESIDTGADIGSYIQENIKIDTNLQNEKPPFREKQLEDKTDGHLDEHKKMI